MEKLSSPASVADYIIGLYSRYGDEDYIGEPVSQVEHMSQCAMLAEKEGYDDEVILAAFLHDIGHLCEHVTDVRHMNEFGVEDHDKLGGEFLRDYGFSEKVASLVENHVQAKRYLTFADESYYNKLSEASKETLRFQGGPMSSEEAAAFTADPLFEQYVKLRRWDEQAKVEEVELPPLDKYRNMIFNHITKNFANADSTGSI